MKGKSTNLSGKKNQMKTLGPLRRSQYFLKCKAEEKSALILLQC